LITNGYVTPDLAENYAFLAPVIVRAGSYSGKLYTLIAVQIAGSLLQIWDIPPVCSALYLHARMECIIDVVLGSLVAVVGPSCSKTSSVNRC
jgi:hypothetical protein